MKVICDRAAFVDAVSDITRVVASRSPSPVLLCVRITAGEDGVVRLAATDLEVGLRLGLDRVDVNQPGEALVPADKLAQIVRACDDSTVTLTTEGHTMTIDGERSHFTIYGFDPAEAPPVRDLDESAEFEFELPAADFKRLVELTIFAAGDETNRYAINGVLLDRDEKRLRMVATDGRRLAVAEGRTSGGAGETRCIIPTKALGLLNRLMSDPDATVRVSIEESQAVIGIGDGPHSAVLSTNLVEGTFPPFEDVIPKDGDKKVTANVDVFRHAIQQAALLTNEESKGVRMNFDGDQLRLSSRAPEMGEAEITVPLVYEGDALEIGFNPGYIVDALKVVDSPDVIIELKNETKPGVIRSGAAFTYVVMPVTLT